MKVGNRGSVMQRKGDFDLFVANEDYATHASNSEALISCKAIVAESRRCTCIGPALGDHDVHRHSKLRIDRGLNQLTLSL